MVAVDPVTDEMWVVAIDLVVGTLVQRMGFDVNELMEAR
jgi:hypothetical protein